MHLLDVWVATRKPNKSLIASGECFMKLFLALCFLVTNLAAATSMPTCDDVVVSGYCMNVAAHRYHPDYNYPLPVDHNFDVCLSGSSYRPPRCPPGCIAVQEDTDTCDGIHYGVPCTRTQSCVPKWITELPF